MSGHSKWATIKRKKAANDAKRSNLYAKLLRAVEVAARQGGGDPAANMTLASAIEKARSFSVPNDNIERAVRRGTGQETSGKAYEELTYEGYAPGGIAVLVEALSDNRNRTAQEVKHAFAKHGGSLGEQGSTAWMFARKGMIVVEKSVAPEEDRLLEIALESGAEDLRDSESSWDIVTAPQDFKAVSEALQASGVPVFSAEITMMPHSTIPVSGGEARAVLALIEALEECEDVQSVYANFDIPEQVMAEVG